MKKWKKDYSDYSGNTKENCMFMIVRYLHLYGDNRYSKLYSEAGYKYMVQNKHNEKDNNLEFEMWWSARAKGNLRY